MYILDDIAHKNRLLKVNPKLKVIFALLLLLISLFSKSFVVPILIFAIMFILTLYALDKKVYPIYLGLIGSIIAFGFFNLIFMGVWYGNDVIFKLGFITFKKTGLNMGILVFSRILGCSSCMLFMALTTPIHQLFKILQELKFPSIFIDMVLMMYRYIFVLLDEFINMKNAAEVKLGFKNIKTSYKSLGIVLANLFIRAWNKGEKIYIAMESRNYNGTFKTLEDIDNPKSIYIIVVILIGLFLILLAYLTKNIKVF
ncbi:cobalt ECF transporter T component CbiQ [Methanocaldococcus sp. 16A]